MNPTRFKLLLALFWLIPGVSLLVLDAMSGRPHLLPVGSVRVPFAWVFLLFAAFNLVRWWLAPAARRTRPPLPGRGQHPGQPTAPEPDSAFRFDDHGR